MGKRKVTEPETYQVEVITRARVVAVSSSENEGNDSSRKKKKKKRHNAPAKWEYFVKWAGYDSDADSWEPEENVAGCQILLASFWNHVGTDDADYQVGFEARATDSWIKKQKKIFRSELENERLKQEKRVRRKQPKGKERMSTVPSDSDSEADESDDEPIHLASNLKRKRSILTDDEVSRAGPSNKKPLKIVIPATKPQPRPEPSPATFNTSSINTIPSSNKTPAEPRLVSTNATSLSFSKSVPTRRSNPHSDIAGMTSNHAGLVAGISIKQRLAQGALAPTAPKAASQPMVPIPRTNAQTLKNLSFKKKPTDHPSSPEHPTSPTFAPHQDYFNPYNDITPISPHQPTFADVDLDPPLNIYERHTSPIVPQPQPVSDVEVDEWLRSVMPPAMAAPLVPAQDTFSELGLPPSLHPRTPVITARQPSATWKWTGPLYLSSTEEHPALCNVSFNDISDHKPGGLRFSIVLASVDRIDVLSFHDAVDMESFLPACHPAQQFAQLVPATDTDKSRFETLAIYMSKKQKVFLVPVMLDGNTVGHIIIFPKTIIRLCWTLKVPEQLEKNSVLISALVPWALSPPQISENPARPFSALLPSKLNPPIKNGIPGKGFVRDVPYHHALRILKFPQNLYDYLSEYSSHRNFSVWFEAADGVSESPGLETVLLRSVLGRCRIKEVGYSGEPRIIFVHIGALRSIHKLPNLAERRTKGHIYFWTYGTHESVSPHMWGMREIYPSGGVVTFSPGALLHNPEEVLLKLKQIEKHPLWCCYILPSVLGMAAKIICKGEDPLALYDRDKFPLQFVLSAIEEGNIALIHAPPSESNPKPKNDPHTEWLREYLNCINPTTRSLLETCLNTFSTKYSRIPELQWSRSIEDEITADLLSMQRQLAIMTEYRRYIVYGSERDPPTNPPQDGLERVTPSEFDFMDLFFPKQ